MSQSQNTWRMVGSEMLYRTLEGTRTVQGAPLVYRMLDARTIEVACDGCGASITEDIHMAGLTRADFLAICAGEHANCAEVE